MSVSTVARVLAGAAGVTIATLAGLLYVYQTALIYPASFPEGSRTIVDSPSQYGMPYTEHRLVTPDLIKLHVYVIPHEDEQPRPTVLMLHANAGNMGHRLPIARDFFHRLGCHVVMLSYRGYGLSTGEPTEPGLRIDAQTTLDWIRKHAKLSHTPVIAYGQSIGGAVAIDLAARNPETVRALIVENTFLSIPKLIPSVLPMLRHFTFLCRTYQFAVHTLPPLLSDTHTLLTRCFTGEIWPSYLSITKVPTHMAVLFLSARDDEIVPSEHMAELYRLCKSPRKEIHTFDHATHSTSPRLPHSRANHSDDTWLNVRNPSMMSYCNCISHVDTSRPSTLTPLPSFLTSTIWCRMTFLQVAVLHLIHGRNRMNENHFCSSYNSTSVFSACIHTHTHTHTHPNVHPLVSFAGFVHVCKVANVFAHFMCLT